MPVCTRHGARAAAVCPSWTYSLAISLLNGVDINNRYKGNGPPLQHSHLENPMDRGAWWAAVHGFAKSWTWLSDFTFTFHFPHWRRKWQPTPAFLPGESQGRGAWWAAVYGVAQSWTRLKWLSSSSSNSKNRKRISFEPNWGPAQMPVSQITLRSMLWRSRVFRTAVIFF